MEFFITIYTQKMDAVEQVDFYSINQLLLSKNRKLQEPCISGFLIDCVENLKSSSIFPVRLYKKNKKMKNL